MSLPFEPRDVSSVAQIAQKMRFAGPHDGELGKTVFLIGAGCSMTARVPGAVDIAKLMTKEVGVRMGCAAATDDPLAAYDALVTAEYMSDQRVAGDLRPASATVNWHQIYDEMFERHYSTPDDVRDLFGRLVAEASGAINWAHLCLGELVKRGFVSTVLTTNFDQLVLSGMVRAGVIPVVCDGVESLNRISGAPRHPQLIELHGSRHTYLLRNRAADVASVWLNAQASAAIQNLLKNATTLVVIGYEGRETGVMDLLIQAAEVYRDKNIYWVQHSDRPDALGEKPRRLLETSCNGGLLRGQDADRFFLDLCKALQVGAPSALSDPLGALRRLIEDVDRSTCADGDIKAEIVGAQERLARLSATLQNQPPDLVDEIRKLRLAGQTAEAYARAKTALGE